MLQDKGYFEVTVRAQGTFAVGVATRDAPLDGVLSQEKSATAWTLTSSMQGLPPLSPGSTLGIALDQGDYPVQVYFYLDGKVIHHIFKTCTTGLQCGNGYFRLENVNGDVWKIATDVWTLTPYEAPPVK